MKKTILTYLFRTLILAGIMATQSACQDEIDPNTLGLPNTEPRLVVDAWINDTSSTQYIRLSYTQGYFNNNPSQGISDAKVSVTASAQGLDSTFEFSYIPNSDGIFKNDGLRSFPGLLFTLKVEFQGETYTAQTITNRGFEWVREEGGPQDPSKRYDTLFFEYRRERLGVDSGYYLQLNTREPAGRGDFWRFVTYRNNVRNNRPRDIRVIDDLGPLDGNTIPRNLVETLTPRNPDKPYMAGDSVRLEIWSLDPASYFFWVEAREQAVNGGPFADPPANIRTNVQNTNPNGPKAAGWFGATSIFRIRTKVEPGRNTVLQKE